MTVADEPAPPRVVIVGGGFSGAATAAALRRRGERVTLVGESVSVPELAAQAAALAEPISAPARALVA